MQEVIFAIQELEEKINTLSFSTREILNFDEAVTYLQVSRSFLYKLTGAKGIPHYKPSGKLIFFKKTELDEWILSSKIHSKTEEEQFFINRFKKC